MYIRCQDLRRQSPGSRVRFPGTQNSTDKVEEKEFTELCLSVHFSVTLCSDEQAEIGNVQIRQISGTYSLTLPICYIKLWCHLVMLFVISGLPRSNESLGLAPQVWDQEGTILIVLCAAGKRVKSPLFKLSLPGSNFMYPQIARTSIATGPTASWSAVTVRLGGRQFLQDRCSQLEDYCELVTEISIVLFESFCACVYLKWTFFCLCLEFPLREGGADSTAQEHFISDDSATFAIRWLIFLSMSLLMLIYALY